ncbi:response regulator receiver protein [Rhizobium leguminosarum]|uniref:response regulator receiver protein n=1 Tax=Rhizobium leguminosarum TaxID=384 RepID=UPI001C98C360|nr:response regulator receiver protein [Rhizobium leguminosarum]MBY5571472.1 response regulator receiver protein [Rhizobium leguminosarum]MBY5577966.1 response regulator receiver protein [Rhizobium leguminosarum]
MRVVVFEDDHNKFDSVRNALIERGVNRNSILRVENVSQFALLGDKDFDLCIIDIRMPGMDGGTRRASGPEILRMLDYSGRQRVPLLAITAFPEEAERYREQFAARGCIIYDFENRDVWSRALDIFLAQARDRGRYEFVVVAALKKERDAFSSDPSFKFESIQRHGLDLWDCEIDGRQGAIVKLPRMGLVNATAITARILELYAPSVLAMSGICAGVGDAKLGQLLVTDLCWEYQSGKWLGDIMEAEPYQVTVDQNTRGTLAKLVEEPNLLKTLEKEYAGEARPSIKSNPKMAIFSSGSAVIASEKRLDAVKQQHRKIQGIDMEIYGFHRAAELSVNKTNVFSCKVVVDKANESKDDELHEYGSFVSAQFTIIALRALLSAG